MDFETRNWTISNEFFSNRKATFELQPKEMWFAHV